MSLCTQRPCETAQNTGEGGWMCAGGGGLSTPAFALATTNRGTGGTGVCRSLRPGQHGIDAKPRAPRDASSSETGGVHCSPRTSTSQPQCCTTFQCENARRRAPPSQRAAPVVGIADVVPKDDVPAPEKGTLRPAHRIRREPLLRLLDEAARRPPPRPH